MGFYVFVIISKSRLPLKRQGLYKTIQECCSRLERIFPNYEEEPYPPASSSWWLSTILFTRCHASFTYFKNSKILFLKQCQKWFISFSSFWKFFGIVNFQFSIYFYFQLPFVNTKLSLSPSSKVVLFLQDKTVCKMCIKFLIWFIYFGRRKNMVEWKWMIPPQRRCWISLTDFKLLIQNLRLKFIHDKNFKI